METEIANSQSKATRKAPAENKAIEIAAATEQTQVIKSKGESTGATERTQAENVASDIALEILLEQNGAKVAFNRSRKDRPMQTGRDNGHIQNDLKKESDRSLIAKTVNLVREERELLTTLLHHLREIDRRRLYSALEYKSLFDFTVRHLGYPHDQAYRRISAMKLLRELPELEEKLNTGEISLTHLGYAQNLFNSEKKHAETEFTRDQKLQVFEQISNKPVREAERITLSLSSKPQEMKPDKIKPVTSELSEFKFMAANSTIEKVEKLKGWLAHSNPNISLGELVEKLCDLGINQWDPAKKSAKRKFAAPQKRRVKDSKPRKETYPATVSFDVEMNSKEIPSEKERKETPKEMKPEGDSTAEAHEAAKERDQARFNSKNALHSMIAASSEAAAGSECLVSSEAAREDLKASKNSVKKPSAGQIRRDVFARAGSACENCGSTFALEVDHIRPRALGGSSGAENLRLLCKACNQRAAIAVFGVEKMESYLESFFG